MNLPIVKIRGKGGGIMVRRISTGQLKNKIRSAERKVNNEFKRAERDINKEIIRLQKEIKKSF